ncbi:hypothetical protein Patl1_25194 [Pistacia atlantica]|uniref:Uncharacterized protein n=1 Tax=Pistacia atlantica TaxID=434234 RepID=A0ACC1AZM3_9ROSI|nr:hypothetical protein Patl1_25194 [Pistacia atlantica]
MHCNDPTSARQAMCFHFDPKISPSRAFVQFPQTFHNLSENDIYDSENRLIFRILWYGFDGLQGLGLFGTNFYIKREALYGISLQKGFMYHSLVEDYFTGFKSLHYKGWKSVYLNPSRPQFLGTSTTDLNVLLTQGTRWGSGLAQVLFSKFSPPIYGLPRMSLLASMGYAEMASFSIYFFPLWCFATIPQLCLLNGIPLFPEVSDSKFYIFLFIFLSSLSKHLHEVLKTGGSIRMWRNEQRIWMIKGVTCYFYGTLNAIMSKLGLSEASFVPTNKAGDDEQTKRHHMGIFDFQTSTMFLAPLVTLIILNIVAFFWGVLGMITTGDWEKMFAQVLLSFYILIMSYAIIEGMVVRKDTGRIPPSVTMLSAILLITFLSLGSIVLMY